MWQRHRSRHYGRDRLSGLGGKTQWLHIASTAWLTSSIAPGGINAARRVPQTIDNASSPALSCMTYTYWKPYYTMTGVLYRVTTRTICANYALVEIEKAGTEDKMAGRGLSWRGLPWRRTSGRWALLKPI